MDELSASVGLTRGALYHQFGGKDGLLEAVVAQIDGEIASRLSQRVRDIDDRWERFQSGCRGFLEMALEPDIQRITLRDAPAVLGSGDRTMHRECHRAMVDELEALMADGIIVRTDAHALTRLLSGAVADAALWIAHAADPEARLAQATAALDSLLAGLATGRSAEGERPQSARAGIAADQ